MKTAQFSKVYLFPFRCFIISASLLFTCYWEPANNPPEASDVQISGDAISGHVLTGSYTYTDEEDDAEGVSTYRWLVSDTEDGEYAPITGAESITYAIASNDKFKYIRFEVTPVAGTGELEGSASESGSVGPVLGEWTHPADLADNISPDEFAFNPQVAMDNNGNAIIVWAQFDGICERIFKSEYRNGMWTHPSGLTDNISPDGEYSWNPQVSMDDNGNAVIVWRQSDGSNMQIFKSEHRNGIWTHPSDLADNISPNGEIAWAHQVSMDDSGNAIIVWRQIDGSNMQIFKSEYRNGAWICPSDLTDNISFDGENADYPQVAMDNNGNALIVWHQMDGSYAQIFKSEYRNGAWIYPSDLTDNISLDGDNAGYPQVAMDSNGNAIIVWLQSDGSNYHIFKSEYRNDIWTHPSNFSDKISPDGAMASAPQISMDDNGNAIIVWHQSDGSNYHIFKSEYRNSIWSHPTDLTDNISPDGEDAYYPQVAMDNYDNAIIVWNQYDDNANQQIFMSEYRVGVWTHPCCLADNISPDGEDAYYPQVAMDNNGNAIIVWPQYDGSNWQIFKSEYR